MFTRVAFIIGVVMLLWAAAAAPASTAGEEIYVLEVEGTITRGQLEYIQRHLETAQKEDAALVVIILNTPGGLVDATLKINEAFLNAAVPVAVLVSPQGAIAASAGVFLVLGSDIAAMAPGTTVGAAYPVALSAEGATPADDKTATFLAKHLRSLAGEKGRPADVAEKFVTENLTLAAEEALELG
ncbi:MAG TPA: ATP-dependent Clp protease proteolytic subunit, partial [Bacillota bacterium]|nr:ATP-dependent Clp protease proteolytic subunit [Bacillota bacterium]